MKPKRERKPTRLKGYDYSHPGVYFVTVCTFQRACIFGNIVGDKMHLNKIGKIVEKAWLELPDHYPHIDVEHYIIMPNHLHGLVEIKEAPRRGGFLNPPLQKAFGLTEIIRGFKTWSAREVNVLRNSKGTPLWQRSFYDKIIRDEKQFFTTLEYIRYNPQRWADDKENIQK